MFKITQSNNTILEFMLLMTLHEFFIIFLSITLGAGRFVDNLTQNVSSRIIEREGTCVDCDNK